MPQFVQMTLAFYEKERSAIIDAELLNVDELQIEKASVVEAMTARGRTGIVFQMVDANGKKYFAKTSAQMIMNGLASATRGFCTRVGDNPDLP